MKIDKKNPKHWLILLWSGGLLLLLLPLRVFKTFKKQRSIVMYGHKLNGNLLALYEYARTHHPEVRLGYLSIDPSYIKTARKDFTIYSGLNPRAIVKVVLSDAIITDHSLHHFTLLKKLTNIRCIDVWHGIPYKGFDETDLAHLHSYDQVWVSSEWIKELYIKRLGFTEPKVKVTGYARAERLLHYPYTRAEILKKYGLEDKKTLLVAPTWKQDAAQRSIVPFDLSLEAFFQTLRQAYDGELQIIFRAHLNVREQDLVEGAENANVRVMPYADYPIAEDFLAVSDVLLTDWSSIAFDSLAIDQPVVFMDVPAPFKKGFCIGPEYRFGATPGDGIALQKALNTALGAPDAYQETYRDVRQKTKDIAYGQTLAHNTVRKTSFRLLFQLLDEK